MPCINCDQEFYGEKYIEFVNCPICGQVLIKDKIQILYLGGPMYEDKEKK